MSKDNDYVLDDRARTALVASREYKWEGIKCGKVKDEGPENCALCQEYRTFNGDGGRLNCAGCPVFAATGEVGCRDTPFSRWADHQRKEHHMCKEKVIHCIECAVICNEGIAFLKELETKFDKPKDVVISFKSHAEYEAFRDMLRTNISVPSAVREFKGTSEEILRGWMLRTQDETDSQSLEKEW